MSRGINYTRRMRRKHINRKKKINHELNDYWAYKYEGQLSKGKIHCGCPLCRTKTNNKGKHKSAWAPHKNWKHSDLIKIQKMLEELKDY